MPATEVETQAGMCRSAWWLIFNGLEGSMEHQPGNPVWHALIGPQSALAIGDGRARHYPRTMAPFSAIKEAAPDAYADLAIELPSGPESRLFRPSEELAPSGWCVVSARPILQIIAESGGLLGIHPAERRLVSLDPADAARAGAVSEVADLVDELCKLSPEFAALWRDNDVNVHGEGVKRLRHPVLGPIALEYSAFAVDGRPDLSMVVYNPATRADADLIRSLVASTTMVKKES